MCIKVSISYITTSCAKGEYIRIKSVGYVGSYDMMHLSLIFFTYRHNITQCTHNDKYPSDQPSLVSFLILGELTIRSVGRTLKKEITRIENVRHANNNLDSVSL